MPKSLVQTDTIKDLLKKASDDPQFDASNVRVYETLILDTRPVSKRGSIFNGARHTPGFLNQMAAQQATKGSIPLDILHLHNIELPVGSVFHSETREADDGEHELWGLFYLPTSEEDLNAKIDANVINSVSMSARPASLLCSECGWDYMGEDASLMNFLDQTCANDHTVGQDGVYVRPVKLDQWYEVSLVGSGAAGRAKIVSPSKSVLALAAQNYPDRLAASGLGPEITLIQASATPKEKQAMSELTAVLSALSEATTKLGATEVERNTLKTTNEALTSQVSSLEAQLTSLQEKLEAADNGAAFEALTTERDALKTAIDETVAFLTEQAKVALTAAGKTPENLPTTVAELTALIKEIGTNLHQTFGGGGRTTENLSGAEGKKSTNFGAFKTAK